MCINFSTHESLAVIMKLRMENNAMKPFFFLWRYSPNLGLGLPPWNFPFYFGFLDLRQSEGLLGRVISSSQGLSTCTQTQKNAHIYTFIHTNTKHPCPEWDSNPRFRLPWPANVTTTPSEKQHEINTRFYTSEMALQTRNQLINVRLETHVQVHMSPDGDNSCSAGDTGCVLQPDNTCDHWK
jgi:hypothetical protein